jgi:hypothetical protein
MINALDLTCYVLAILASVQAIYEIETHKCQASGSKSDAGLSSKMES